MAGDVKPIRPCRGDVWRINFDPTMGNEIAKARPAIVISSDAIGKLAIKTVVPLTTWKDRFADNLWMVRIEPDRMNGLDNVSAADALQIRGVAVERFIVKLGRVSAGVLDDIASAIAIVVEYQ